MSAPPTQEEFTALFDRACESYHAMKMGERSHHFEKTRAIVLGAYAQQIARAESAEGVNEYAASCAKDGPI